MSKQLQIVNVGIANEAKVLMGARFVTMIKYFIEDTQMYMQEIEKGLKEHDAQTILVPAHTIKSSARQLGAEKVSEVAKWIELLCRESIVETAVCDSRLQGLYEQLKQEVSSAMPVLLKLC